MYQNISSTILTELCGVFFLFLSFLASAFLSMTSFYCPHCRKTIATIVYTHAAEWNSSAKRLLQTHRIKSKPVATKYNETDEKIKEKQSKRLCMAQKSTWSIKSFVRWQWWRPLSLPSSSPSLSIVMSLPLRCIRTQHEPTIKLSVKTLFSWRTKNSGSSSSSSSGSSNSNNNVIIAAVNKWLRWGKEKNTKTNVSMFGAYLCFGAHTHTHTFKHTCMLCGRSLIGPHFHSINKTKNFGIKMINITSEIVSIPLIFNRIG